MNQHVLEWLPAYHDGELSASRQRQVQDHLATCPTCLAELKDLESLSGLLKTNIAPELTSPERFAAQVQLRLPRRPLPSATTSEKTIPRWVLGAPLALIAAWAFLLAALWITSFLLGANWVLGPQNLLFTGWFAPVDLIETAGGLLMMYFGLMLVTTILWSIWVAFWLAWKNNQNLEPESHRI